MRVTELRTAIVGNPPPSFGGRYFVFLELVTDDGITGVGEVYAATFHPRVVVRMIEDVVERHVARRGPLLDRVPLAAGVRARATRRDRTCRSWAS